MGNQICNRNKEDEDQLRIIEEFYDPFKIMKKQMTLDQ